MRHGDAKWPDDNPEGRPDDERPLSDLGRQEVATMATFMERAGVKPDLILSSPLVRARQTAEIVHEHFDSSATLQTAADLAPGGSPAGVLAQILRQGRPAETVLTGHMPGVGMLAGYLAWNQRDAAIIFRTAGVCRIDLPDSNPAPGYGDLLWLLMPRMVERVMGTGD